MISAADAADAFGAAFGRPPEAMAFAPGRVNLIGEHTDYNEGWVLPAALDRGVTVAAARRGDRQLQAVSARFGGPLTVPLDDPTYSAETGLAPGWLAYPVGAVRELERATGAGTGGVDLWIGADLPAEAGLSSSAALTVATVMASAALNGLSVPPMGPVPFARLVQGVERRAGTRCGVMDPLVVLGGVSGAALLIDCRTFHRHPIAIPPGLSLVVCDSGVPRALADSAYNVRRAECEAALEVLREALGRDVRALRDVTAEDLDSAGGALPEPLGRRARHVVSENARVLAATDALATGDRARLGALLAAAHTSLRDDYEVSAPELDALVEFAALADGCWGSCMTGAGFGGATVSLVESERVEAFGARVAAAYAGRFGRAPAIFASPAAAGARRLQ